MHPSSFARTGSVLQEEKVGAGNLVSQGKKRERYKCKTCGKTFSAHQGTMFEGRRSHVRPPDSAVLPQAYLPRMCQRSFAFLARFLLCMSAIDATYKQVSSTPGCHPTCLNGSSRRGVVRSMSRSRLSALQPNEHLKQERLLRGWSQIYVANALGTDGYTVNRWERGRARPSPYFRQKLCELFEKNAFDLGLLPLPLGTADPVSPSVTTDSPTSIA